MKTKEQIIERITSLVEEVSLGEIEASSVKPTDRLIADLKVDSLDYASIMLNCEEWVGVKIKEDKVQWNEISTVENLADLFVKHQ